MKLLADAHISPRTVEFLKTVGHDVVPVSDRLAANATDVEILELTAKEGRAVKLSEIATS